MTWILLATAGQFLLAVVALIDKYIVTDEKAVPRPFVYAFYTLLFSGAWIGIYLVGLFPLSVGVVSVPSVQNIERPTLEVVALSFLAAYTFFIALVSMFNALKRADASDVVPVVGATSAIGSFGLGYFFLNASLSPNFIFGIILLVTGTYMVSRFRFSKTIAMYAIHAGLFFALHYVSIKGLFLVTSFDNGFFWSRIAFVLFGLTLLLVPNYLAMITKQVRSTSSRTGALVVVNKTLAGISTLLILRATDLGDVSVVQALGGLQFVFILVLGILFGHRTPSACGEQECREPSVIQKALFVAIITLGFLVLFR